MNEPNRDCPQFDTCAVNNCPLHSVYPELSVSELDAETECRAWPSTRQRIAAAYPGVLAYEGLTEHEHRREVRRRNRTPEEVARDKERMAHLREFIGRTARRKLTLHRNAEYVKPDDLSVEQGGRIYSERIAG